MKTSEDNLTYKLERAEERITELENGSKCIIQPNREWLLEKLHKKSVMV